ncbi:stage II sporulation protein R [Oceanobacillus sp. CAU 1775]
MNKLVFLLGIFTIVFFINYNQFGQAVSNEDYQVIPDEAIRLRILANSESPNDQAMKEKVRDAVNAEITEWVANITDIEEARKLIQENLAEIENIIKDVVGNSNFTLAYDSNITFPMKLYGDYLYPAGEYEAILVTIGEGKGTNWWCVLFPPLCFLDFSFGTTVESDTAEETATTDESEEVEVKFFLFEWLGWS